LTDTDARPNPHIGWLDVRKNGYALFTAGPDALEATLVTLHDSFLAKRASELEGAFESHFETFSFRVPAGSRDLERNVSGSWQRWDLEQMRWI